MGESNKSLEEARAYINNKVFGDRLREVSKALLQVEGKTSTEIFGSIDSMKVKSCMTLFDIVSPKVKSYVMTKKELESLREFCVSRWPEKMGATHGVEITANICFDSDRMDLLRVGILPVPERMATKRGAELVGNPNYGDDYDLYVEQAKLGLIIECP